MSFNTQEPIRLVRRDVFKNDIYLVCVSRSGDRLQKSVLFLPCGLWGLSSGCQASHGTGCQCVLLVKRWNPMGVFYTFFYR